jgi:hypothetical protein
MYKEIFCSPDGMFDRTTRQANQTDEMPIIFGSVNVVTIIVVSPKDDATQISRSGQESVGFIGQVGKCGEMFRSRVKSKLSYIRQWQEESIVALAVPQTDCQIATGQSKHIFIQPRQLN